MFDGGLKWSVEGGSGLVWVGWEVVAGLTWARLNGVGLTRALLGWEYCDCRSKGLCEGG